MDTLPGHTHLHRKATVKRLLLLTALTAVLGMSLVVAAPVQAVHAVNPTPPVPVNVLPSTVRGGVAGLAPITKTEVLASLLYRMSKYPEFWTAVSKVNAGTATPAQTTLVSKAATIGSIPATKMGALTKVVGPVSYGIAAYSVGVMAGNGVLDLVGVDGDHAVCVYGGDFASLLSLATGRDCNAYEATAQALANANNDAISGTAIAQICTPAGACIKFTHTGPYSASHVFYCYAITGPWGAGTAPPSYNFQEKRGSTWSISPISQTGARITACNSVSPGGTNGATGQWPVSAPLNGVKFVPTSGGAEIVALPQPTFGNPDRTIRCVILGTNGTTYTASTVPYKETDEIIPQPVCPDLPAGVYPAEVTITLLGGPSPIPLFHEVSTPEFQHAAGTYPECMGGTCALDLQRDGVSCFTSTELCTGWYADPDKTTTYTCRYGTHTVDLGECTIYRPMWEPGATGTTLGNPETGEALANPANNPFGSDLQDPSTQRECFPSGWGVLNPVEWVFKPVTCALEWAFVPRPTQLAAQWVTVTEAWDSTVIVEVPNAMSAWAFEANAGGCGGITAPMDFMPIDLPDIRFFNACPGDPLAQFAGVIKPWMTFSVILACCLGIASSVAGVIQYKGVGE